MAHEGLAGCLGRPPRPTRPISGAGRRWLGPTTARTGARPAGTRRAWHGWRRRAKACSITVGARCLLERAGSPRAPELHAPDGAAASTAPHLRRFAKRAAPRNRAGPSRYQSASVCRLATAATTDADRESRVHAAGMEDDHLRPGLPSRTGPNSKSSSYPRDRAELVPRLLGYRVASASRNWLVLATTRSARWMTRRSGAGPPNGRREGSRPQAAPRTMGREVGHPRHSRPADSASATGAGGVGTRGMTRSTASVTRVVPARQPTATSRSSGRAPPAARYTPDRSSLPSMKWVRRPTLANLSSGRRSGYRGAGQGEHRDPAVRGNGCFNVRRTPLLLASGGWWKATDVPLSRSSGRLPHRSLRTSVTSAVQAASGIDDDRRHVFGCMSSSGRWGLPSAR